YHCAQNQVRQHAPKKNQTNGAKTRDKISRDTFKCHGWLHITINDEDRVAFVKILHSQDHAPYYSIDIPPEVREFVHQNHKLTPAQV
ncbi:hypothetical protein B0H11DRAFT_1653878, partial [Mycena galericulata]